MFSKKISHLILVVLALLTVVLIIFRSLFQSQLFVSDDYEHHAARTANYYLALKQGQLPPRWAPNLNNSFGYPAFLFTYHVPYAVATGFHLLSFSIQQSVNLAVVIFVVIGVLSAYWYARSKKLSQLVSVILGLAFVLNPYMLLNIFWRGALGEIAFYCLLPLFFYALDTVFQKRSALHSALLALSAVALVLSHFISVVILAPIVIGYLAVRFASEKKDLQKIIRLGVAMAVGGLLSAWYWLPAIFERRFIAYDSSKIATLYQEHFLSFGALFSIGKTITSSEYFLEVLQIGSTLIIALVIALWMLWKHSKQRTQVTFWLVIILLSVGLCLEGARPAWEALPQLTVMQFPWRFLWLANLGVFFLLLQFFQFSKKNHVVLAIIVAVSSMWSSIGYAQPKGYVSRSDFDWYEATTTASSFDEFRPIWAKESYDLSERVIVQEGEAQIEIRSWSGTQMEYSISAQTPVTIVQHTLYFPGWELSKDGEPIEIKYDNPENPGLISFTVPEGQHSIKVSFSSATSVRTIGHVLFAVGVLALLFLIIKKPSKK